MRQLLARLFGKPAAAAPPASSAAADPRHVQMANAIATGFSHHGIRCSARGELVEFPDSGVTLRPEVVEVTATQSSHRSHIEVHVALPDGRVIDECFMGIAGDEHSAIGAGVVEFFHSDLHVFTHSLFRAAADDQILVEDWTIRGVPYEVSIGAATLRGERPEALDPWVPFAMLEDAVRASDLAADVHWIRIFYGHHAGETIAVEVLLDNEHWVTVERQMAAFDWPRSDNYYSIRIFLMLRRLG